MFKNDLLAQVTTSSYDNAIRNMVKEFVVNKTKDILSAKAEDVLFNAIMQDIEKNMRILNPITRDEGSTDAVINYTISTWFNFMGGK